MSAFFRAGGLTILFIASALRLGAQEAEPTERSSTRDGVYTEAQAEQGRAVVHSICTECHMDAEFVGTFIKSWAGASVGDLFEQVATTMPENRPGGLRPEQYAQVLAYIFQLNGLPPGDSELKPDIEDLREIIIEGSEG